MLCRVCGHASAAPHYIILEMMYGTREPFDYFQCVACGCLQIARIPGDLSRHYRDGYYSYRSPVDDRGALKRWVALTRNRGALFGRGFVGPLLERLSPRPDLRALKPLGLGLDSRVLDVGCGAGHLLRAMADCGMRRLHGIDPYIAEDIENPDGFVIRKAALLETDGPWDVVMFHHSFEHLPDPHEALAHVATLLAGGGWCLLRVPTVSSWAWEHYGTDWVQLDAPRHLHLFSHESIRLLAESHGFVVEDIVCDSTSLQFWGSEQYRQGIALRDGRSLAIDPDAGVFSRRELAAFRRSSERLNKAQRGDQAIYYLRRLDQTSLADKKRGLGCSS